MEHFLDAFHTYYFPNNIRDYKEAESIGLIQGGMSVLQYKTKFIKLSHYASHFILDDEGRAKRFQKGLPLAIYTHMTPLQLRSFADVVETAKLVE